MIVMDFVTDSDTNAITIMKVGDVIPRGVAGEVHGAAIVPVFKIVSGFSTEFGSKSAHDH
jgi:hypothetical protein